MSAVQALAAEFAKETRVTRRLLERVPADRFAWRPHPRSFTAGGLAGHIVECVGWAESVFTSDGFDFDPATLVPVRANSMPDLLAAFDDKTARGLAALTDSDDAVLAQPWRLSVRGRVRLERPKADVMRDFTLSHLIHHRGQMSVYLRLLDVPVPGSYGPTADEQG
jgi:uncharacterized damage-inducible protein DinB